MRTPIVLLAGLLAFSHGFAADNLIRLSKPLNLEMPTKDGASKPETSVADKGAAPADGKDVIKKDMAASAPSSATASASAGAKAVSKSGAKNPAAAAKEASADADEEAQTALAQTIKTRLEALRAKNAAKASSAKPIPFVSRSARVKQAKEKANEQAKASDTHEAHVSHWSYEGEEGPARWGKMDSSWAQCANGDRQSPIDIHDGIKVDLEPVKFEYKPVHFKVIDNGHTVQVNLEAGNYIALTGRTYELVQFHFHRPSEERINGKSYPMVVHLVHKSEEGKLAVVALLVEEGAPNSLIQNVWNNLPLEKNEPVVPLGMVNVNQMLPMMRDYYTYMGSLTTPPCSEGVLWIVMKQPIKLSATQIAIFSRLYPMNARPIQASSGRMIKESN